MSIGSWSCPTSWEGEGDSSLRGRKRRSYGLSKARGSVSRPCLSSTNRIKANYLVPKGSYAVSVWGWVKPVVRNDEGRRDFRSGTPSSTPRSEVCNVWLQRGLAETT